MLSELLELTRGLQRELQYVDKAGPSPLREGTSSDWERQVFQALHGIALGRGFKFTELSMSRGPTDIMLERAGRRIYIEISRSRNLSAKVRDVIGQFRERAILNPLILVIPVPVNERFVASLPLAVKVVQWQSPDDDAKLIEALEEGY
jgi:hypothetical protein